MSENEKINLGLAFGELMSLLAEYQLKMADNVINNTEGIELAKSVNSSIFKFAEIKNEEIIKKIIDLSFNYAIDLMKILGTDKNTLIKG